MMIRQLNRLQPWGLFILRVVLGVVMTYHGFQKLIPTGGLHRSHLLAGFESFNHYVASLGLPYWLGYVSLLTELLGGIFLILGFLTRLVAFLLTVNMLVALVMVDLRHGYTASELALALCAMATLLIFTGSGAAALDRKLGIS
jgi:putative oxidoreductase